MVRDSAPPKVETLARLAGRWTSGNGVTILAKSKQEPLTRLLVAAESGKEDKASYNEDSEEVGVVEARRLRKFDKHTFRGRPGSLMS